MTSDPAKDLPDSWMVRPCSVYEDEYSECKSLRGRFHHYFVTGEKRDCGQWLQDFENCMKFQNYKSFEALDDLIESEKQRRKERIAKAKANDVWEYRTEPPAEWNKPLPEGLEKMRLPKLDKSSTQNACVIL